jgi:antitoxin CptB
MQKAFRIRHNCSKQPRMTQATDIIRKRLLWRATHRGIKEMDILVGGYAEAHLGTMDEADLATFTNLLELPDQELLAWATGVEPIPQQHDCAMLRAILAFRPTIHA